MKTQLIWLILTLLFSLLFIALIAAGSHLLTIGSKAYAIAAFLFALAAALGQITSLALYIRIIARAKATPKGNTHENRHLER